MSGTTMRLEYRWVIFVLLSALTTLGQQPAPGKAAAVEKPPATGSVTGRVYLNDTKAPARRATVYLQPVAELVADAPDSHGQTDAGVTMSLQTRFDGSFAFNHVVDGAYYVIASSPGYVSPYTALSLAEARSPYGDWQPLGPAQQAAKQAVLKGIPRITVSNLPVSTDVTLERAAAVSGNIAYDDGGPAGGLQVAVLSRMHQEGKETWAPFKSLPGSEFRPIYTDDRGNYRVSGLPAGKYLVQVTLDLTQQITYLSHGGNSTSGSGGRFDTITIYSGSTPRLKDAAGFSLDLGEERAGEDLRIPISKLHTIHGNFVSAHDGHVVNGGQVTLYYADDKSIAAAGNSSEEDPGFTLNFVYEGDYTLTNPIAFDVDYELQPQASLVNSPPIYTSHPRHLYGSAAMPLHVDGDMDGVTLAVPEPSAKEAQAYKNALQQQERPN
jgi:hypothetical protein